MHITSGSTRCLRSVQLWVCVSECRFKHRLLHHTDAIVVHDVLQHVEDLLRSSTLKCKDSCKRVQAHTHHLLLALSHNTQTTNTRPDGENESTHTEQTSA